MDEKAYFLQQEKLQFGKVVYLKSPTLLAASSTESAAKC